MRAHASHPLLVCESHPGHGEAVAEELVALGYEVRRCADEEAMIAAAAAQRPSAVVYELRHQVPVDLAILALVRRVLPDVPLIVVARELAEAAMQALRAVHPDVFAAEPVSPDDLRAAVRTAVRHARAQRRHPEPAVA